MRLSFLAAAIAASFVVSGCHHMPPVPGPTEGGDLSVKVAIWLEKNALANGTLDAAKVHLQAIPSVRSRVVVTGNLHAKTFLGTTFVAKFECDFDDIPAGVASMIDFPGCYPKPPAMSVPQGAELSAEIWITQIVKGKPFRVPVPEYPKL